MRRLLVSACLLGQPVRYDGKGCQQVDPRWRQWHRQGRLVTVCPECLGGLPIPRPAAEIQPSRQVLTLSGADVTDAFAMGADRVLRFALAENIKAAILKANSPSCGSEYIYDGSFSGKLVPGEGITAVLLRRYGITVFSEHQLDAVEQWLLLPN